MNGHRSQQRLIIVRAADLTALYEKLGWTSQSRPACDRQLAEFMFRNLQGSDYALAGYGRVDDVLTGDIETIRNISLLPRSNVHIYAVMKPPQMVAFMLWYSLEVGGPELFPPRDQEKMGLPDGFDRSETAYGDWLIVDTPFRVLGLGGVLFAIMLHDMAQSGYHFWYGRTVVPDNLRLYERLYHHKGRANVIGTWQDGPVTRIGFIGDLRGRWTEELLRVSMDGNPELISLI